MGLHRGTWLAIAVTAFAFALLNLHCWRPGIGGRTDRQNGTRPVGSELELFYGWPACYLAELLRSDDPGMGDSVLSAPFHITPYSHGWVSATYFGWLALILDVLFAVLCVTLMVLVLECNRRERWSGGETTLAVVIALILAAGYISADMVSVHL